MGTKVYDNYADLITFNRNSKGTALRPIGYGDELVTNGTFDTDLSGWTLSNSPAWVSGRVELSRNGGIDIVRQSFATTIGAVYKVTADVTGTSGKLGIGVSSLDDSILNVGSLVNTSVDRLFVATTNTTWIYLITEVNGTSSWDNVSVKEVIFDREGDPLTLFLHPEGVPRIEYDADRNLKGLLIEPDGQNKCLQSEDFSTNWPPANATITTNDTTAPDGTTTADKLEATTAVAASVGQTVITSAVTYTFSVWLKEGNTATTFIRLTDIGTGENTVILTWATRTVSGSAGVTARVVNDLGSGDWIRISLTHTLPAGGADVIRIFAGTSASGTAGDYIHVWGAQFEAGPIATSYIPTTTASVNRGKDDITLGSASSLIGQTEGTLYVEVDWRLATGTEQVLLTVSDGTGNNRVQITNIALSVQLRMVAKANNDFKVNVGEDSSGFSGIQKFAFAYKTDDFELYRNGSSIATDTNGSLAALATLTDIDFQAQNATAQANMHIRSIQIIPRRLSDEQLIELTS